MRSSRNEQEIAIPKSAYRPVETRAIGIESAEWLSPKGRDEESMEREEPNVRSAPNQRNDDDNALERFMLQQKRHASALMLPKPEVPVFDGDPIEYQTFVRAFENLIEANTDSHNARLYYLIQYTRSDVKELMKSCLSMKDEEGYLKARQLLKERYGQDYKIATSYIERVTNGPPIKSENAAALQRFSALLRSCKNMLKDIGYLSKMENPDSMRRIINRLPFTLRRRWRDVADAITEEKSREVTIDDIPTFVESKARASSHPIFGNLSDEVRVNRKQETRGRRENNSRKNIAINRDERRPPYTPTRSPIKCPGSDNSHWLSQCPQFRGMSLIQRFKLVRQKGLCDNCFTRGYRARSCPKQSFCTVQDCKEKHSTFLHENTGNTNSLNKEKPHSGKAPDSPTTRETKEENAKEEEPKTNSINGYVKSANGSTETSSNGPAIGLSIVPIKVRAVGSDRMVQTYAFLDTGWNTSFCSQKLMKQLNIEGKKTTLSLTTMEKAKSKTESSIVSLELSDLNGENPVRIETCSPQQNYQ